MKLDAIIVADSGSDSYSGSNPLKLKIDGRVADIQVVKNYIANAGKLRFPVDGDGQMSWTSSKKLNGLVLLDYLTKQSFCVELIDNYEAQKETFEAYLNQNPSAIVISTTFIGNKRFLRQLTLEIRGLDPSVPIIVGGPFIYFSYLMFQRMNEPDYLTHPAKDDFLFLAYGEEPEVDLYIISLKGENTLSEVLKKINNNQPFKDSPNCAYRKDGTYTFTKRDNDLQQGHNRQIDWNRMPDSVFTSRVVPLQASNGCPYNCSFCNFVKDRRYNFIKPLDHLIAEMKAVEMRGAQYVWFVDDNFRLGKDDLEMVCKRFIDEKIGLKWMTFVRADVLKRIDMNLLRQAGCFEVQLGLESADPQILKNMNKKTTPRLYDEILHKVLRSGINGSCYFIIGFPGETLESARRTRSFIIEHQLYEYEGSLSWSIFPFILSPLSPIYEPKMRHFYNLTGYMEKWRHATMDSKQAHEQVVQTIIEIDGTGPIYRGDNLRMLRELDFKKRKAFFALRHRLSKNAFQNQLKEEDMYNNFQRILE